MQQYHKQIFNANIKKGRLLKYLLREIKGISGSMPKNKKWLFILGCYNSGTTLLHDLLAKSPEVASLPGEGQFLSNQFLLPSHIGLSRMWVKKFDTFYLDENNKEPNASKLKKQWFSYMNDRSKPVLMQKSPTDIARIKWLDHNFENAYFIGIIRNGFAVAEGINRKAGFSIEEASEQWKVSNEVMLRDLDTVKHSKVITYENLSDDPSSILKDVCDFCGITNYSLNENEDLNIHGVSSGVKNMNFKSFESLKEEEKHKIESIAGDLLLKLNYKSE